MVAPKMVRDVLPEWFRLTCLPLGLCRHQYLESVVWFLFGWLQYLLDKVTNLGLRVVFGNKWGCS